MSNSTNLTLPFLTLGQAQKHVTVNESLLRLDALVQLAVVSATTTAEPGSPSDGQVYILPSGKTGTHWAAMANAALAYYRDGVWEQIAPREGWLAFAKDTDTLYHYSGSAWIKRPGLAGDNAFTGVISIESTQPILHLNETDAASDEKLWRITASGGDLFISTRTDANGSGNAALSITRTGTTIDTVSLAGRVIVGAGLYTPSATGGDKGSGTINAQAVYDDNTLLTCGPLELMTKGAVDLEKWDALVPNIEHKPVYDGEQLVREAYVEERRHDVMHAFAAMVAEGFDPRDPANFCARMKQDGAVPGLITETEWRDLISRGEKPDTGTMLTRTFLALDNLAVAFATVVERLEALERA